VSEMPVLVLPSRSPAIASAGIQQTMTCSPPASGSSIENDAGIYLDLQQQAPLGRSPGGVHVEWRFVMNDRGHGWVIFASIVLGVAGIMRIFDAIWAFRYHGALPQNLEDALFGTSLKPYGWVWLAVA